MEKYTPSEAQPCKVPSIHWRPVGTNEEYDPATNRWTYKTPKPTSGGGFGIAVYKNKIYCIGDNVNEVYDPVTTLGRTGHHAHT